MRILLIAATLPLIGCAIPQDVASDMDGGLDALVGQPIEAAFASLGEPGGKISMGEDTVYGWGRSYTKEVAVSRTGFSNGNAGLSPFYGKVTSTQRVPILQACTIDVVAGPDSRIKAWRYRGNADACKDYAEQVAALS